MSGFEDEVDACPICLDPLVSTTTSLITLVCSHTFHSKCIIEWKDQQATCPMCRATIEFVAQTINTNTANTTKNLDPRARCRGITKIGRKCLKFPSYNNEGFCHLHRKRNIVIPRKSSREKTLCEKKLKVFEKKLEMFEGKGHIDQPFGLSLDSPIYYQDDKLQEIQNKALDFEQEHKQDDQKQDDQKQNDDDSVIFLLAQEDIKQQQDIWNTIHMEENKNIAISKHIIADKVILQQVRKIEPRNNYCCNIL